MKEAFDGMTLSAQLTQQLGPSPGTLPNLKKNATTAATQKDLDKLRRPDGHSHQLNGAWRDTAEYERQIGELERKSHH